MYIPRRREAEAGFACLLVDFTVVQFTADFIICRPKGSRRVYTYIICYIPDFPSEVNFIESKIRHSNILVYTP